MCCTLSNIWGELFWNSVVIQLNHWFLVVSSFGSPNKVLSLSHLKHSVSRTWRRRQQYYSENNFCLLSLCVRLGSVLLIFPHRDVDMWGRVWISRFRGAWQSLNFYKEYLFGFKTLVFATSRILSMHKQLVTLQRETWNRIIFHHISPKNQHWKRWKTCIKKVQIISEPPIIEASNCKLKHI